MLMSPKTERHLIYSTMSGVLHLLGKTLENTEANFIFIDLQKLDKTKSNLEEENVE